MSQEKEYFVKKKSHSLKVLASPLPSSFTLMLSIFQELVNFKPRIYLEVNNFSCMQEAAQVIMLENN
jgi:hypothetical protein